MRILSVNVSLPKIVEYKRDKVETGIFKEPVADRVMVRQLNLDGNQADLRVHGGENKAVGRLLDFGDDMIAPTSTIRRLGNENAHLPVLRLFPGQAGNQHREGGYVQS